MKPLIGILNIGTNTVVLPHKQPNWGHDNRNLEAVVFPRVGSGRWFLVSIVPSDNGTVVKHGTECEIVIELGEGHVKEAP